MTQVTEPSNNNNDSRHKQVGHLIIQYNRKCSHNKVVLQDIQCTPELHSGEINLTF